MPPKKLVPGNPLWISWLKEWEQEKRDLDRPGGEHLIKAIRNATKSLEKNPVEISHPSKAVVLHGIGPTMIKYLTERLTKYCEEEGLPMPEPEHDSFESAAAKAAKKKQSKKAAKPSEPDNAEASTSTDTEAEKENRKKKKKKKDSKSKDDINLSSPAKKEKPKKAYAPKALSGSWAILVGMVSFGSGVWKSQEEVVEAADPFYKGEGDSLRDKGKGGGVGQHYSGWSGMTKLVKEGYIDKQGRNPVTYQLSHDGFKIARRACRNAKKRNDFDDEARSSLPQFGPSSSEGSGDDDEEPASQSQTRKSKSKAPAPTAASKKGKGKGKAREESSGNESSDDEPPKRQATSSKPSSSKALASAPPSRSATQDILNNPDAPFLFSYLAEGEIRVRKRDDAEVQMDETTFTPLYLIEFRVSQAKHVMVKRSVVGDHVRIFRDGVTGPEGGTVSAYLPAKVATALCPGFDSLIADAPVAGGRASRDSEKENTVSPAKRTSKNDKAPEPAKKRTKTSTSAPAPTPRETIDLDSDPEEEFEDPKAAAAKAAEKRASKSKTSRPLFKPDDDDDDDDVLPRAGPSRSASGVYRLPPSVPASTSHTLPDINTLSTTTMPPGSYTIHLTIDSREKPGLSNKRLEKMLTDKGVNWETQTLAMGDAVWIARCKSTGQEVVLDACLERKRLDDLVSSLKDGRYTEQKNRMHRSGISRLMYLVEDHDSKNLLETYGSAIWTVKSSLQVSEGFHVQMAWSVAEACSYLAMLTKTFVELHKHTTLTILPDSAVNRDTYLSFITHLRRTKPATSFFITFDTYQRLNAKIHTIHSNWSKMVASINQMSLERAMQVVERFPSPAGFFEELELKVAEEATNNTGRVEIVAEGTGTKRKKKTDDSQKGECWLMRQTVQKDSEGAAVRPIGQALSTNCWKLFTADKY